MKDVAFVVPILIVGGTLLIKSMSKTDPFYTQELLFLAFLFGLLFLWHRGKQASAERMKALELGWDLADGPYSSSPARNVVIVGMLMPVSLLGLACLASSSRPDLSGMIWFAASVLGMTTLICGTILLLRQPALPAAPERNRQRGVVLKSHTADPDEFDVVSQRASNGHPSEVRS
ncbi:hypothetical protein [Singulisphaera acidiphila]|uniref:Uncharacterized protein n=1 Tax=Singulisphaera acidiphila (strain ATCC BAA-1392 / DSM 18658 / VKM B-2454 / MOB10) TaxID=886293 RepID=L0DFB7_SINAD|nr:hypothetical protein [Singulisphaera acidiphila]AGA27508.1 hypothetical protein Sinac_3236 [Singulisphaera acidiphila DSM 18658]